jgi:sulfur carrier protein
LYLNESFQKGPFLKFYYKTQFGMEIIINGQSKEIPEQCSVQHLVSSLFPGPPAKGIAVAINQSVVPGSEWATHLLHSNDQVMLIKATQGG